MDSPMESPSTVDEFVFRASKRRKVSSRQRADSNQEDEIATQTGQQQAEQADQEAPSIPEESDQEELGLNYVIRARKQQQRRQRGGIEFSATRPAFGEQPQKNENETRDAATGGSVDMNDRFARQTGYKVQVDKHMMEYVDAELARRNLSLSLTSKSTQDVPQTAGSSGVTQGLSALWIPEPSRHKPPSANTGALQEVQLDELSRKPPREATGATRSQRVRPGPDGKPWRSRRNRRNSDDVRRDALVESILQEHGLNAFETTDLETSSSLASRGMPGIAVPGNDEEADERAAAEFRRQFLEAAEEKRDSVSAGQQSKQKPVNTGEIAGGPKLGGSRSQRARMHAMELEKEKEKNAKR